MPLSDVYLRKLKAGDKPKHADGGGLYLFLSPAGGMLWRMDYRFEGKRKTLSFGSYPAVGLKDARARHEEAKKQLAAGIGPAAEKKRGKVQAAIEEKAAALTFEAVAVTGSARSARHGRKATRRKSFPGWRTSFSPISGTNRFPPWKLGAGPVIFKGRKTGDAGGTEVSHAYPVLSFRKPS